MKFPMSYGTWRFINTFTSAHHLFLSWSPQYPSFWRSTLILSSHLCLHLPIGLFPSGLPTKTLYAPLPSTIQATCPTHLVLFDSITPTIFGVECRFIKAPHYVVFSTRLSPIPLRPTHPPQHPIQRANSTFNIYIDFVSDLWFEGVTRHIFWHNTTRK